MPSKTKENPFTRKAGRAGNMPDNPSQLMQIKVETVDLTPQMAHQILARNDHNRTIQDTKVEQYAGAIKRGEWALNGDAIRIDANGNLIDGQHRLLAVIKADKPIKTLIITGLDPAVQETVDIGKKRTLGDMLKLRGENTTARLAGAVNLLYTYSKSGRLDNKGLRPNPTPQQLINWFEKNTELRDFMRVPHDKFVSKLLTPSLASALYYLFSLVDSDDADVFFEYLATGNNLASDDPILLLRERLMREQAKPHGQILPPVRAALAVKAFNFWRNGEKVATLKWTGGGAHPQPFPRVAECSLVPECDK